MRHDDGFTIMELLVVVVLIGALAVALTVILDPMEQIRRSKDASALLLMRDVHGAVSRVMTDSGTPWSEDLVEVVLNSEQGLGLISTLTDAKELQQDVAQKYHAQLGGIFLTAPKEGNLFALCYQPISRAYMQNKNNRYDKSGNRIMGCPSAFCYTCYASGSVLHEDPAPTVTPGPYESPTPTPDPRCLIFDPEYPTYAFTCNYSSRWSQYGCTNYCVIDKGCGGGKCKATERRLLKDYYAPSGFAFVNCLMHHGETAEEYCISGQEANCTNMSYPSSDMDYYWGCTNPRRPYQWIKY